MVKEWIVVIHICGHVGDGQVIDTEYSMDQRAKDG